MNRRLGSYARMIAMTCALTGLAAMPAARAEQASGAAAPSAQALQELLDKQAIAEVMMTYCRALDHLDEPLLRSVFHPDSQHNHGFKGPSSDPAAKSEPGKPGDFVAYALQALTRMTRTHHQLGNIFVEVHGDVAYTEAYFTAYHRMRAKGDPKAGSDAYETQMDLFVSGRYMDRMEKRNGVWKIARRTATTDWERLEPPSPLSYARVPPELRSYQSREDFVYRRKDVYGD
ncbi:nuclear transport factor 2 family protein [Emcibacter sp. SYSU 3D8]|uniref:nuclear transport factor 2 family protein n=1 Tax=Emcibacter sp. SYSU 3D8 TaxID=3133969 RepID=UPI0031FECD12